MIFAIAVTAVVAAVLIAGMFIGLTLAVAIGVKHRREHAAELDHYEQHRRGPSS